MKVRYSRMMHCCMELGTLVVVFCCDSISGSACSYVKQNFDINTHICTV